MPRGGEEKKERRGRKKKKGTGRRKKGDATDHGTSTVHTRASGIQSLGSASCVLFSYALAGHTTTHRLIADGSELSSQTVFELSELVCL